MKQSCLLMMLLALTLVGCRDFFEVVPTATLPPLAVTQPPPATATSTATVTLTATPVPSPLASDTPTLTATATVTPTNTLPAQEGGADGDIPLPTLPSGVEATIPGVVQTVLATTPTLPPGVTIPPLPTLPLP